MSGIRSTFFEISPLVNEGIGVWPGDVAFSRQVALDMSKGDHLTLSAVTSTVHLGAHADAPSHYRKDGEPIHLRNPLLYYGDCQVIQVQVPRGKGYYPATYPRASLQWPSDC